MKHLFIFILLGLCSACSATVSESPCDDTALDCPTVEADKSGNINQLYKERTWQRMSKLERKVIQNGIDADIPIQAAQIKVFGPSEDDAVRSLAAKIWIIENAQHTIDATYYIFKDDLVGYAMLGAMCNAVKRGVDVRLMVDSVGSFNRTHKELKGLIACSAEAGFMQDEQGNLTNKRARVQVVIINSLSKLFVRKNRRSHDKLLIVDGQFPNLSWVMTGGRNISLDYYGLNEDGTANSNTFKDLEVLLKSSSNEVTSVSHLAEKYYNLLFLHDGNKQLQQWLPRDCQKLKAQDSLLQLKAMNLFNQQYTDIENQLEQGFFAAEVKLAHELNNLLANGVVYRRQEILNQNPNSIVSMLEEITIENPGAKHIKVISPYAFLAEFNSSSSEEYFDGRLAIDKWLSEDPERTIEVISNSVLTSDNFFAQSIIDIDSVPRALLPPEMIEDWQGRELSDEFELADVIQKYSINPRVRFYQLGKIDSATLGGDKHYGKLHAKAVIVDNVGFVGTSNLDYRSRLFNNEVGYFYQSEEVSTALLDIFNQLKADSYLWGSQEWFDMRKLLSTLDTTKTSTAKKQRKTYHRLNWTGLKWQM